MGKIRIVIAAAALGSGLFVTGCGGHTPSCQTDRQQRGSNDANHNGGVAVCTTSTTTTGTAAPTR